MKTLSFAGFKIKVITSPLIPKDQIYAFSSPHHAKHFVEILKTLDLLIKSRKITLVKMPPKQKIISPHSKVH